MSVLLRKILGDLRSAPGQVLLLFAAILIGQAAMTAAFMARSTIAAEIDRNYAMAKAPDVTVEAEGIDGVDLTEFERLPGVGAIDSVSMVQGRYRLADGGWRPIIVFGRREFNDLRASKIFQRSGAWPPADGDVAIEQSGLGIVGKNPGETLDIRFGRNQQMPLRLAGTVHDPMQAPSWQENMVYGYTSLETMTRLAGPRPVQLRILLGLNAAPPDVARAVSDVILARGGRIVRVSLVPATHPHADLMNGLVMLLSAFSVLAYALALFLASSIVAAFAQRQERQIAVLRALGASRLKIGLMHLATSLAPALAALFLGLVAGEAAASVLKQAIADQLNISLAGSAASEAERTGLLIAGAAGVLIALLVPIWSSARKTVTEVLQNGLKGRRRRWLNLNFLQPLDRLAVAEAFQRPVRTIATVAALTVAGLALLISSNMNASLVGVIDRLLAARQDTIWVVLGDRPDMSVLGPKLAAIPAISRYELWDRKLVTLSTAAGSTMRGPMYSPPARTTMGRPNIIEGKWPSAPGEIAISQMAHGFNTALGLGLGSEVGVVTDGATTNASIVGIVDEWGMSVWASPGTFERVAKPGDRQRELRATLNEANIDSTIEAVERAIIQSASFPAASASREGFRAIMVGHFFSFFQYLLFAALTAAIVGAAGLSATIGSNVLGRTREIGVLRALGAGSVSLYRLVLVQALALTIVSLVAAIALSIPLSSLLVRLMADNFVHMYMPMKLSWSALAGLSAGAILLAAAAAIGPAIRARRIVIREAITYE